MSITFRPAIRENVGLILGLIGPSGGGKTYTAMRLATGISGDKPFAVIDTEAGRAKHYADQFRFDHADLKAPFRPEAYAEAIKAADEAGYPAIVVDSFSHEHAGDGGLLDWHEEEYQRLGGRDQVKMTAWIKPKMAHRKMVSRLLQVRAHLILCFRAEEKIEMVRRTDPETGRMKTEIVPKQTLAGFNGWIPICEKNLPFELTASFMLMPDHPGYPVPIKLEAQHRDLFPLDQPITEESGRRLAEWARGGRPGMSQETQAAMQSPEAQAAQREANQKFAAADAAGDAQPRMPNGEPIAIVDRAVLLGKIDGVSAKLALSNDAKRKLWKEHCGDAKKETADPAALQDLLAALRAKQAEQPALT